jgi:hypothetical protein
VIGVIVWEASALILMCSGDTWFGVGLCYGDGRICSLIYFINLYRIYRTISLVFNWGIIILLKEIIC